MNKLSPELFIYFRRYFLSSIPQGLQMIFTESRECLDLAIKEKQLQFVLGQVAGWGLSSVPWGGSGASSVVSWEDTAQQSGQGTSNPSKLCLQGLLGHANCLGDGWLEGGPQGCLSLADLWDPVVVPDSCCLLEHPQPWGHLRNFSCWSLSCDWFTLNFWSWGWTARFLKLSGWVMPVAARAEG